MTDRRDPMFDPRIADLFESDPTSAPDSVMTTVLAAVRSVPQDRVSRIPWRFTLMNTQLRLVAAAAVIVVAVGGAAYLAIPRSGVGGPGPSPSPSPSPCVMLVSTAPMDSPTCRYTFSNFGLAGSVAGAEGWTLGELDTTTIQFNSPAVEGVKLEGVSIALVSSLAKTPCQSTDVMTDTSTTPFVPSAPGKGPEELMAWIVQHAGAASQPAGAITIDGHPGISIQLSPTEAELGACAGHPWLMASPGSPTNGHAIVDAGWSWRLTAIDVGGQTLLIQTFGDPGRWTTFLPKADAFLAGLRFP